MRIKILEENDFSFFENNKLDDLNKKTCSLTLDEKNLVFIVEDKKIAYLISGECFVNRFKNKLIFFKKDDQDEPIIIFELKGEQNLDKDIKNWIRKRNHSVVFRSPLICDYNNEIRESVFSKVDQIPDLRGFSNAFLVFGVLVYGRLIIEHFLHHGTFFLDNFNKIAKQITTLHFLVYALLFISFTLVIFILQRLRFKNQISEQTLTFVLLTIHPIYLLSSIWVVYYFQIPFFLTCFMNLYTFVFFLKGISYSHVLWTVRFYSNVLSGKIPYDNFRLEQELSRPNKEILSKYKDKEDQFFTFYNYGYFLMAPTLCYQLVYPMTNKIRKIWLLKKIIQLIFCSTVQMFILLEYWLPVLQKSPEIFQNKVWNLEQCLMAFKYIIQLAVPETVAWLLGFYYYFHLYLNILSELLCFGDRNFYNDWWNCRNLQQYWKDWNLPVHQWFLRHVYYPLQYRGMSRDVANTAIFLISAGAHEYIISLSIRRIGWVCFFAFNMQYVYIIWENFVFKKLGLMQSRIGNLFFWLNMCALGQPILAIVYYLDSIREQ